MDSRLEVPLVSISQVRIPPRCVSNSSMYPLYLKLMLDKIKALILENTFTSLRKVVPHALPLLGPLSFLCHQKWDSVSKLPLIPRSTPILMLSGARDEVVPCEHMKELWEIATRRQGAKVNILVGDGSARENGNESERNPEVGGGKSKFVEFERGCHSAHLLSALIAILTDPLLDDTCVQLGYWTAITNFLESVCL